MATERPSADRLSPGKEQMPRSDPYRPTPRTRVLVTGANGFIGTSVVAALHRSGMRTRCVVRDPDRFRRRFPDAEACGLDLTDERAHVADTWRPLLEGIDAVVNVAGLLQPPKTSHAWNVHHRAPEALFAACEATSVRRVIHISAVGIEETDTLFAASKRAGEASLTSRDLDWTILRPVLVVGDDSYGGTSLVRALAAIPLRTPVIGDGRTPLQVIHKEDLAEGIVQLIEHDTAIRETLEPAAPDRLTLEGLLAAYREWLGLAPNRTFRLPPGLAKWIARIGDVTRMPPVTSTALAQLNGRLTGDGDGFRQATGVAARDLPEILAERSSGTQDLWHARLFLLRPLVRMTLALLWAVSGVVGLLAEPASYAPLNTLLGHLTVPFTIAFSALDLGIAAALVRGWRPKLMARVQLAVILGYTVGLTVLAPALWTDPFGALLKNIPLLLLVLMYRVLEEER